MITRRAPLIGRPDDSNRDYRNLFNDAPAAQPYAGFRNRNKNRRMFRWLAARFAEPYDWPEGSDDNDNHRIPAGYTYLAQFVIHDTIQSDLPDFSDGPTAPRNNRSARLVLDTIYGKGPGSDPLFYAPSANALPYAGPAPDAKVDLFAALRAPSGTGFLRIGSGQGHAASRDLPRRACPFAGARPGSDVLIADVRNDDNAIVSQITVLFHLLHNIVYAKLKSDNQLKQINQRHSETRMFAHARKVVTHVYRTIVFEDLLRRLLHPIVYEKYCKDGEAALLDQGDARMPLEFSHAAARFGHFMIRDSYAINAELGAADQLILSMVRHNSARRAMDMPLASRWLVNWSKLFEKDGDNIPPLRSRRMGPTMTAVLVDNAFVRDIGETADPAWHAGDVGGVAFRDLLRGGESGLRSTREIVSALPDWVCELSPLVGRNPAGGYEIDPAAVKNWLVGGQNAQAHPAIIKEYIDCLTADIPLLLFILIEAAETKLPGIRNGECLGAVGSVILAEFFFREFWRTYSRIEGDPDVARAYAETLGQTVVDSMPKLIALISNEMNWGAADPKFW